MIQNKNKQIIETSVADSNDVRKLTNWEEVKKGKYLTLSTTKYQNYELKLLKLEGTIPTNYEKVASYFFENLDGQKNSREMCEQLKVIEQIDADTQVLLFKTKGKFVVSSREMLGIQHRRKVTPNEYLITRGHLDEHPAAPKDADTVRAEGKIYSIFITKESENSTKLQAFMLMDPKGSIPIMVFNLMIEEQLTGFELDVNNILSK
ncbi:hypothetical protein ABPG74_014710 [Tetrahymena malaccensis]